MSTTSVIANIGNASPGSVFSYDAILAAGLTIVLADGTPGDITVMYD